MIRFFFYLLIFLFACNNKNLVPEEGKKILSLLQNTNRKKSDKVLIVVLQNESCICTEENMNFTVSILKSKKYEKYKKAVILSSNNHPFRKKIGNSIDLETLVNSDNLLLKKGLIIMTDRIFIFDNEKHYYATEELKGDNKLLKEKYLSD